MPRLTGTREAVSDPVGRRHGDLDWTARTRETVSGALRYSRFVTIMKRVLPITAGLLIAAVIAYSLVPRQSEKMSLTYKSIGTIDNDLTMLKPRLTGTDRRGNPFVITADAAVQDKANIRRATLKNVQADMTFDKSRWLSATAARGLVDMQKNVLALTGGIAMFSDDGYELHSTRADVDLKKGIFHGPEPVQGHGPAGTLSADSFDLDRETNQLVLQGHVQMTIIPGEIKQ